MSSYRVEANTVELNCCVCLIYLQLFERVVYSICHVTASHDSNNPYKSIVSHSPFLKVDVPCQLCYLYRVLKQYAYRVIETEVKKTRIEAGISNNKKGPFFVDVHTFVGICRGIVCIWRFRFFDSNFGRVGKSF
jgi:hypothetical protein